MDQLANKLTVEILPVTLLLIPLIGAILQFLKRFSFMAKLKKYFPLVGGVVAYGILLLLKSNSAIVTAIIIGFSTSGGYNLLIALNSKKK